MLRVRILWKCRKLLWLGWVVALKEKRWRLISIGLLSVLCTFLLCARDDVKEIILE